MPVSNGELVESLVKRALVKHPQLNKTGISGDQGDGHQPYGFAAKQLLNAEKSANVTPQKLEAIARRLGELLEEDIKAEDLVGPEVSSDADPADAPHVGNNHQEVNVEGDNSDGIAAGPGSNVSVNRQAYKSD